MTTAETYGLVRYDNFPITQTHPSRLYALGKLVGMNPAPPGRCRMLEIGSSEGVNLIPLAHRFPDSEFVGFDVAAEPIERGLAFAKEFGLGNLRLLTKDLLEVDLSWSGQFDYIIAHGLYGWTPPLVSDKILEVMGTMLSPQGIGFVSYNAKPAGHIRRMVREMMLFHARGCTSPQSQAAKAGEMLALLARQRTPQQVQRMDAYDAVLVAHAIDLLHTASPNQLIHDDMAPVYDPPSVAEFIAHAHRHNLQYLDDAGTPDPRPAGPAAQGLDEATVQRLLTMAAGDRVAELQYYDYLRMRRFRQSLVCRAVGITLDQDWLPERAAGLYASTQLTEAGKGIFVKDDFRMQSTHPQPLAYLRRLIALWPESAMVTAEDSSVALALFRSGAIDFHGAPALAIRFDPHALPCADPMIRFQSQRAGPRLTTAWHEPLEVDEEMRRLLPFVDGTRDCAALAGLVGSDAATVMSQLQELAGHAVLVNPPR